MADRSPIEWTHATWNPTTGCDRVSAGCDHCYALDLAARLKAMGSTKYQRDGDPRTSGPGFALTVHPAALNIPRRWAAPRMIFVNSMSDLFHAQVPLGFVREVFAVMADTPRHTYQMLTKRARRLRRLADRLEWPPNLWMGVSVEDAENLTGSRTCGRCPRRRGSCPANRCSAPWPAWTWPASVGSSPAASPARQPGRRTRRGSGRCAMCAPPRGCPSSSTVQWGGRTAKSGGRTLDGQTWSQYPRSAAG